MLTAALLRRLRVQLDDTSNQAAAEGVNMGRNCPIAIRPSRAEPIVQANGFGAATRDGSISRQCIWLAFIDVKHMK